MGREFVSLVSLMLSIRDKITLPAALPRPGEAQLCVRARVHTAEALVRLQCPSMTLNDGDIPNTSRSTGSCHFIRGGGFCIFFGASFFSTFED